MAIRTFYEILGISPDADDEEIRRAYRRVMQEHHPDQNPDNRKAARRTRHLNAARDALLDPAKRRRYDRKLRRKGLLPKRVKPDQPEPTHEPGPGGEKDRPQFETESPETASPESPPTTAAELDPPVDPAPGDAMDRWKRHRSRPSQWIPKPHFQPGQRGNRRFWAAIGGSLLLVGGLVLSVFLFGFFPPPQSPSGPMAETPELAERKSPSPGRLLPPPLATRPSDVPAPGKPASRDSAKVDLLRTPTPPPSVQPSVNTVEKAPATGEVVEWKPTGPAPDPLISPYPRSDAAGRQQQWSKWLNQPAHQNNDLGMELILLPSGRFLSGFPEQSRIEQSWLQVPALQSVNRPFYLSRQPVTRQVWTEIMGTEPWSDLEPHPSVPTEQPYATGMSWQDAVSFCQKLGERDGNSYRLPYQLEWEYVWQSGRHTSFFLPDFDWQMPTAADPSGENRFGLVYAPFLWEFCDDFFDETTHVARKPIEFHSARLGRQLARGTALASRSHGFRVVMVPSATAELQINTKSNLGTDPYHAWNPPQSVPDAPALSAPWIRSVDRKPPALIPAQKSRVQALNELKPEIRAWNLESTEGASRAAKMNQLGMQLLRSTGQKQAGPLLYVQLDQAIHFLGLAGNETLTDYAIDRLCEKFQNDYLSLHIGAARNWSRLMAADWVTEREAKRKSLAKRVRRLAGQAADVHRYSDQAGLLQLYLELLPDNHKEIGPTETLVDRARQRSHRHRQMMHLQESLVQPSPQPQREQASQLGEYLCWELNEWDRGIPYLAQGLDGPLQQVAQYEMRDHDSADARLWIADHWWKLSEAETDDPQPLRARAGQWYQAAYPDLQGDERSRVATRLQDLYAQPVEWNFSFQHGVLPEQLIQRGRTAQRQTGLLLYPGSAIALNQVFSSIDLVTIRGRIGSFQAPASQNFRFQAGPIHATFNSKRKQENYFRTMPADPRDDGARLPRDVTSPHALQPGQFHDFKIIRTDRGELRLSVDGKPTYRTKAEFQGGLMIYSDNHPIEIESLSIRGTPDPLFAPDFSKRYNLDSISSQPQ